MFALIETKNATNIAIHIPSDDNCSTSLKQLVLMLENNATFYQSSYSHHEVVKPEMSIVLGGEIKLEGREENGEFMVIAPDHHLIDDSFEISTPTIHASFAKAKKKFQETIDRLRHERTTKDLRIQELEQRIEDLEGS